MSQYDLSLIDNYRSQYDCNEREMFSRYMALVSEFCVQAEESIKVSRLDYFAYVCVKGLETLTHVFRMLLLYSKNLDITFYNCKKALYYYLEFIGQIGEDNHEFLKQLLENEYQNVGGGLISIDDKAKDDKSKKVRKKTILVS